MPQMAKTKRGKSARNDSPNLVSADDIEAKDSSPVPLLSQSAYALIICRNKHWRYISSFHGPWLQLPPEVLESLAYSNYATPRPRPIDPAVFFDLVKIRKCVDEATNLAVRASQGTSQPTLVRDGGMLTGAAAGVLGLGLGGNGPPHKLSRERKHRMRELATAKLAKAYKLDEIATSVATMQSASTLEDVAGLVLQRNPADSDAKYVHFFHEKIPSRMLAKCTSLAPLSSVIAGRPNEGAPLRTRAVTKLFKEDYTSAAQDLTLALSLCKPHSAEAHIHPGAMVRRGGVSTIARLDDDEHPSSLEPQLLFHRGSTYLTIACLHVEAALGPEKPREKEKTKAKAEDSPSTLEEMKRREASRKTIRVNAKKALRDYIRFLSFFDYSAGASELVFPNPRHRETKRVFDAFYTSLTTGPSATTSLNASAAGTETTPTPLPDEIYPLSALFSATPPSSLPPYPSTAVVTTASTVAGASGEGGMGFAPDESSEAVTYHPLLTDTLHSLLLCHALMATSAKELTRHAHMVARICRIADGYPVFLAARSPARADWIEVLRRVPGRWSIAGPWEQLCAPAPLTGEKKEDSAGCGGAGGRYGGGAGGNGGDGGGGGGGGGGANAAGKVGAGGRWAQEEGKEYPVSTERATLVARWVKDAAKRETEGGKRRKGRDVEVEAVLEAKDIGIAGSNGEDKGNGERGVGPP